MTGKDDKGALEGEGDAPVVDAPASAVKKSSGAAAVAERLVEEKATGEIARHVAQLLADKASAATQSARVVGHIAALRAEALGTQVDKLVAGLESANKRVVQTCAEALPRIARVSPARVAKHLDKLFAAYEPAPDVGKDGLVRAFAALCAASVAYQQRLEPILTTALGGADGKALAAWTQVVLPALKGEPHANARAVVESRLTDIARPQAQEIADFLGIKLRVRR